MYLDTVAVFQGLFILLVIGLVIAKEWEMLLYVLGGVLLILGLLGLIHFVGPTGLFIFLTVLCILWFIATWK